FQHLGVRHLVPRPMRVLRLHVEAGHPLQLARLVLAHEDDHRMLFRAPECPRSDAPCPQATTLIGQPPLLELPYLAVRFPRPCHGLLRVSVRYVQLLLRQRATPMPGVPGKRCFPPGRGPKSAKFRYKACNKRRRIPHMESEATVDLAARETQTMRKRIEALNARARAVMMPGRRGAGWRAQPFLIVPIALFGLAGAVAFGRSLPAGGAAPPTSVEAAGPPMGARAASAALATSPEATSDRIPSGDALDALLTRAGEVAALWDRVGDFVEGEIGPIERVLLGFRPDTALVRKIALALVAEARRVNLDPRILLAVLLVENPDLDPNARSFVGATGLMQVMPMHVGKWPPC